MANSHTKQWQNGKHIKRRKSARSKKKRKKKKRADNDNITHTKRHIRTKQTHEQLFAAMLLSVWLVKVAKQLEIVQIKMAK